MLNVDQMASCKFAVQPTSFPASEVVGGHCWHDWRVETLIPDPASHDER